MDASVFLDAFERRAKRREERREFFRLAGGFAAGAAGTLALTACGGHSSSSTAQTASTGPSDADILNFALNLEYLEAQYYSFAATGAGLASTMLTGTGTQGAVTGGAAVPFTNPVVKAYAAEIAGDEIKHVAFLRSAIGSTAAVSQPAIDISTVPFTKAANAAGLPGTFNPYANDESFLLGAYIFEDVGVSAYHGAAPLISSKTYLAAAAGILAVEAYHAGLIRTVLYSMGIENPMMSPNPITATQGISAARAMLDGTAAAGSADDQGVVVGTNNAVSNIVDADANALAYSRTTAQVLNIVYLTTATTTMGGFFPAGVNGTINFSG